MNLNVRFSENPAQELSIVSRELGVRQALSELDNLGDDAPALRHLVNEFIDMFSLELPSGSESMSAALRTAARDNNLSRILRERAYLRIFRLLNSTDSFGTPLYLSLDNPDTGAPFTREPDFVRWLCANAYITQATLFQRIATYRKLLSLGYTLEDAFHTMVNRPSAVREALNLVAEWDSAGNIVKMAPQVVSALQKQYPIEQAQKAVNAYEDYPSPENLGRAMPAIEAQVKQLVEDVATHPNTRQVLDFVRHDVLGKPEVKYRLDPGGTLTAVVIQKHFDADGNEFETRTEVPFTPPTDNAPSAIFLDFLSRLPVMNRAEASSALDLDSF